MKAPFHNLFFSVMWSTYPYTFNRNISNLRRFDLVTMDTWILYHLKNSLGGSQAQPATTVLSLNMEQTLVLLTLLRVNFSNKLIKICLYELLWTRLTSFYVGPVDHFCMVLWKRMFLWNVKLCLWEVHETLFTNLNITIQIQAISLIICACRQE